MKTAGDKPQQPWKVWLAHNFWKTCFATGAMVFLDRMVWYITGEYNWYLSGATLVCIVVFVVSTYHHGHHDEISCDECKSKMSLDAPGEAAAKREMLRRYHVYNRPVTGVILLVVFAVSFFRPTAWALACVYALWGVGGYLHRVHRPLTPWCPWCRNGGRGDDDDHPVVPEPVPPAIEKVQ